LSNNPVNGTSGNNRGLVLKSKSPTRYNNNLSSANQLPAEAYGKRSGADFNLARRRDASHNRVLYQNSDLDLNVGSNQRAPPLGKGRAAPTPETKQPGLTSRKS